MNIRTKFPIRLKLLFILIGFVLFTTATYLTLAVTIFKEDKVQLVYELNASSVRTLAAEVEASLTKIADKTKLLTQGYKDSNWTRSIFESEPDLIAFTLFSASSHEQKWKPISSIRNSDYLQSYGLKTSEIDTLRHQFPIPFSKVLQEKVWVSNSTLKGGAPIYTLAMSVEILTGNNSLGQHIAVVDLRMDRILRVLSSRSIATVYLIDSEGSIIAHPDVNLVNERKSMLDVPIVADAVHSKLGLVLKRFHYQDKDWLGGFASVGFAHISAVSQVPEQLAFEATRRLIKKSVLLACIILTLAILVSRSISSSFTQPMNQLVQATEKVSRGQFEETVYVNTRDEIAVLARAFNSMANELNRQRKQLEAHRDELERKVQERTFDLEQEKKKRADAQDSLLRTTRLASLGELAGVAAHEVLNPVNNINIRVQKLGSQMMGVEMEDITLMQEIVDGWKNAFSAGGYEALLTELKKPAQGEFQTLGQEDIENLRAMIGDMSLRTKQRKDDFEFVGKEVMRITRIINNMRSLSRVGGERRPLDIHVPLDETAFAISEQLSKNNIQLIKEYSAEQRDLFSMIGDKDELVQVFSNLIRNSLQAVVSSGRRAGYVKLATSSTKERVEIRISDNGSGIGKDHLSRLFEPNFTTKKFGEGTGLGLSISRRLVRAFGGDIELEKTIEGEGTTFLIWFPRGA